MDLLGVIDGSCTDRIGIHAFREHIHTITGQADVSI
jgi:hypothetical protein